MLDTKITTSDIDTFRAKGGRDAPRILEILGKQAQFYNAATTPIGQELLRDVIAMMEAALDPIINESATQLDRAKYSVAREIALSWADKISNYLSGIDKIHKTIAKEPNGR